MTLRRKLFVVFSALAIIALLVTGVALYLTLTWQSTTTQLERHYQRSLLLQRIRAGTFQALKEVDDALTGDHVDAKDDFERALRPTSRDFSEWSSLADTPDEQAEVTRVQAAYERLLGSARQVFDLIPKDRAAAIRLVDDEIDTRAYEQFMVLTEEGVQADREHRRAITAETNRVRATTQAMLAISTFSILSLIFLLAAYLTHDLFRPLRELVGTLDRLKSGDLTARAEEGRNDEIGAAARSLNQFLASVEHRIHMAESQAGSSEQITPPQQHFHRQIVSIETKLSSLKEQSGDDLRPIVAEAETLVHAIGRYIRHRWPIDLDLKNVELPMLIYSVLTPRRDELIQRAVSLEVSLTPEITQIRGDGLRLREALNEIVRKVLHNMPEKGGKLGLRTVFDSGEPNVIRIEIANNGDGLEQEDAERLMDSTISGDSHNIAFAMAHDIAKRHGGKITILSEVGLGMVVQFSLPI